MNVTQDCRTRLYNYVSILECIERRREQENDPGVGKSIERMILRRELQKLEREEESE